MQKQEQSQILNHQQKNRYRTHFFMFINSSSGSGIGQKILNQQIQEVCFRISLNKNNQNNSHIHTRVYFYSMKEHRKKGFNKLKKTISNGKKAVAIVVGGDGTVTWVIQQFINYKIDPDLVPIAIVPVGTGNDFSQQLGWGMSQQNILNNSYQGLKKMIKQWINARQQYFDLWQIQAQTYQDKGKLQVVKQGRNKDLQTKKIKKIFVNYFSFGMDGKIGYSFDMHRTSSRLGNLAMYGILGLLKTLTKTKKIQQLVQKVQLRKDLSDQIPKESKLIFNGLKQKGQGGQFSTQLEETSSHIKLSKNQIKTKSNQKQSKIRLIQKKQDYQYQQQQQYQLPKQSELNNQRIKINFDKDYCNFVALNINSFMGGVKDIWPNATKPQSISQQFSLQSTSDGKLQFIGFKSSVGMASQRVFKGQADKITQGNGPYLINFKKNEIQTKYRTYLQIDGQFIRFTHPKSILIQKSELTNNGKIKVLRRRQNVYQQ